MASLKRNPKSGNRWTADELNAYNITVIYQDAKTFETPVMPEPSMTPELVTALDFKDTTNHDARPVLSLMNFATSPSPGATSAVRDFAVHLVRVLGYTEGDRISRTRVEIPLAICGKTRRSQVDVCIVDGLELFVLLVRVHRGHLRSNDPEAQLIAESIGAFAANNKIRQEDLDQPPSASEVKGHDADFLQNFGYDGTRKFSAPWCLPKYSCHCLCTHPDSRWSEGMKPLDNRRIILSCFEAFKKLVN